MSKKTKKRLQPATENDEVYEILHQVQEYGLGDEEAYIEFRPRTSGKEDDWKEVLEDHLWNLEKYNYRIGDKPRIWLEDGEVLTSEGAITVAEAKRVVKLVRKAKKSHKDYFICSAQEGSDKPTAIEPLGELDVCIDSVDGSVSVGCEKFYQEEVLEFAKKQGW